MLGTCRRWILAAALAAVASTPAVRAADEAVVQRPIVIPQVGVVHTSKRATAKIEGVTSTAKVSNATAVTTLKIKLRAAGFTPAVACDVVVPLPNDARVVSCRQDPPPGKSSSKSADLGFNTLSGRTAASLFRRSVETTGSAGPLEFYGYPVALVPNVAVPSSGTTIEVTYRQPLTAKRGYTSYSLPKSERLTYGIPWTIGVALHGKQPSVAYSPTHPIATRTSSDGTTRVQVTGNASAEPGPFRLLWKTGTRSVDGFAVGYPAQAKEDGYFLLVVQAAKPTEKTSPMKREVTLCIDRSGSMKGKRLSQVRGVANTVLNNLRADDTFNIISYNEKVDSLSRTPLGNTTTTLMAAQTYLKNIRPGGGSDIFSALETALNQPAPKDRLPIVLFFTDGLPIGGKSNKEVDIRNLAIKSNPHHRRVYTFGVDVQVNSPLLQRIADETGGQSVFVLPKESITDKAAPLLKRLQSPVLTSATIHFGDANGKSASNRIHAILPARVPDLFAGDQFVIVGRYRGSQRVVLTLAGTHFGKRNSFRFEFDPKFASTRNSFVPRLWAARRVAQLVDTIRQRGATYKPSYAIQSKTTDPIVARCSREILDLTARHGVVTEYTAFLAGNYGYAFRTPGQYSQLLRNFDNRAVRSRAGIGGVNQEYNGNRLKEQTRADRRNWFWNSRMESVQVNSVQYIGNTVMFRQKNGWIDGRLMNQRKLPTPNATVEFGSSGFWKLLDRHSVNGRQGVLSLNGNVQLKDGSGSVLIRSKTNRPAVKR